MSHRLIALDKHPDVCPVGVGETQIYLFAKCVLKVRGNEATNACQDDQICGGLKVGIDGAFHRVQYIWDANSCTENWGFLLMDTFFFNNTNRIDMICTVCHLWTSGVN